LIPETRVESLTAAECVCGGSQTLISEVREVPMGEKLNLLVRRYCLSLAERLDNNSFKIVLILSLFHIGLACIHTQHSGRAD
jgi:hypothetical protein